MLKIIKLSLVVLLIVFSNSVSSQVKRVWDKDMTSKSFKWQKVNTFGHYLVCTGSGLSSYNPDNGELLWTIKELGGINEKALSDFKGSTLMKVTTGGSVTIFDPFTGEIKFNSLDSGVVQILNKKVFYKSNSIFFAGKDVDEKSIILVVDFVTGQTKWKLSEDFGRIIELKEVEDDNILMVSLFYNYKINANTGEVYWKNSVSKSTDQIDKLGAFSGLAKTFIASEVSDDEINIKFYEYPEKDIFVIGSESESDSSNTMSDTVRYQGNFMAFNISDGSRVWNQDLVVSGRINKFLFHKNGFIIIPEDGYMTKVNFYDLQTAAPKWGKKANGIPYRDGWANTITLGDEIIVYTSESTKSVINVLDTQKGVFKFKKSIKIAGALKRVMPTDNGFVCITSSGVNVLDHITGEFLMKKPISSSPSLITQKEKELFIFDTKYDVIKTLNLEDFSVKQLFKETLKFQGKESPIAIELREKGVLLSSDQNLALYSYEGDLKFNKYFPAPTRSGFIKGLHYFNAVTSGIAAASLASASGQIDKSVNNSGLPDDDLGVQFANAVSDVYEAGGESYMNGAGKSLAVATARFKATSKGKDFTVVFSKVEKDNTLIKVNKDSGEVLGSIPLGREKEPKYVFDKVTSQLFLFDDYRGFAKSSDTIVSFVF